MPPRKPRAQTSPDQEPNAIIQQQTTGTSLLTTLIEKASNNGSLDVDSLGKMLDAYERWQAIEAEREFSKAFLAFKRNPPAIVKEQTVDFETNRGGRTHYKYASLAQVSDEIGAALAPHGITHRWAIDQDDQHVTVSCYLTHESGHTIFTEFHIPTG